MNFQQVFSSDLLRHMKGRERKEESLSVSLSLSLETMARRAGFKALFPVRPTERVGVSLARPEREEKGPPPTDVLEKEKEGYNTIRKSSNRAQATSWYRAFPLLLLAWSWQI